MKTKQPGPWRKRGMGNKLARTPRRLGPYRYSKI